MKRILSQCMKELVQFRRDRLTVALAFALPLAMLLLFGFALRLEAKNIPLAIQDFDRTPTSRAYIERLFATNQFHPTSLHGKPEEVIASGQAKAVVIIPPDFSRNINAGKPSSIQVLIDGTDGNNARVIQNSIRATTRFFLQTSGLQSFTNPVIPRIRLWFNPGRKESLYIVPGAYAVILWIFPSLLMAIAMVREKEQGTILQVYTTSMSATELLLGKGLAYLIIGLGQAIFLLLLGSLIFGLGLAGDPTPLLIGTPLFFKRRCDVWLIDGCTHEHSKCSCSGSSNYWFFDCFFAFWFYLSSREYSFPPIIDFLFRSCSLLYRIDTRCSCAGHWLGRSLVCTTGTVVI